MGSRAAARFWALLFLVFLILKLAHVIEWSWWWVTSPLWLPVALILGGLLLVAVLGITGYKVVDEHRQKTEGADRRRSTARPWRRPPAPKSQPPRPPGRRPPRAPTMAPPGPVYRRRGVGRGGAGE